jgi:hypothetical protein
MTGRGYDGRRDGRRDMNKEDKYFERNNYFNGKLMTVRDFFDEQCYFNEKRWLINRMINGWGVVCGLDVQLIKDVTDKVLVTPGLAIDCCGREILVSGEQEVPLIPVESECHKEKLAKEEGVKNLVICLEYHECKTETVALPPIACDQKEKCEFNRIRDSFKLSAVSFEVLPQTPFCPQEIEDKEKSLHQYLCDRLRPYETGCPKCPESHCVILATVKVDENYNIINGPLDICTHRKLIYSNPLLYDLIECFHGNLPRVKSISWEHNEKIVSLVRLKDIVDHKLTVTFDQQMKPGTINKHTFLFAVIIVESSTGYRQLNYISSKEIIQDDNKVVDFNGKEKKVTEATFVVDPTWIKEELEGYSKLLGVAKEFGADFEIILRGSSILSKEGKALDGAFIGGELPSGNGFQGSDFVSWFSLMPDFEHAKVDIEKE